MSSSRLEVADVIRRFGPDLLQQDGASLSIDQKRVLHDLAVCRTEALGGHVAACDQCGHRQVAYNSCRNRHCPKCQSAARAEWMADREAELLPVPYFHVVFTLPAELGPTALRNKRLVYGLLFRAVSETLQEVAADPKHLGAGIGFLAVLHTWGQNLMHHPHLHCVVPAGGLAAEGTRWIPCRRSARTGEPFFLPVKVLSRVFRGKFVAHLKRAWRRGELRGRMESDAQAFERSLNGCVRRDWVVYAKRPFGGPQQVLKYLARYTHRVAIANRRLIDITEGRVRFRWKDYADGNRPKVMSLEAREFLRRFLMHTLPRGFPRIRYYGFLANRCRQEKLKRCRQLLEAPQRQDTERRPGDDGTMPDDPGDEEALRCPSCLSGTMHIVESVAPRVRHMPHRPHFIRATPRSPPVRSQW